MDSLDTTGQIEELRVRLELRLSELEEQLRPLQMEAGKIRTQLDLITKLLRVTGDDGSAPESKKQSHNGGRAVEGQPPAVVIAEILSTADRALHISEIRDRYLAMGRIIPGKGTEANLIAYIVRDQRFKRVAKGTYALAAEGEIQATPRPRRKRRKKRARR
jgi:hypothetical protein